jgi:hypothetical protein
MHHGKQLVRDGDVSGALLSPWPRFASQRCVYGPEAVSGSAGYFAGSEFAEDSLPIRLPTPLWSSVGSRGYRQRRRRSAQSIAVGLR